MSKLREGTEGLRKTWVVIQTLELAHEEVMMLVERTPNKHELRTLIGGVLHRHISNAFDAGNAKAADLVTALDAAKAEILNLRGRLRAAGLMPGLRAPDEKE